MDSDECQRLSWLAPCHPPSASSITDRSYSVSTSTRHIPPSRTLATVRWREINTVRNSCSSKNTEKVLRSINNFCRMSEQVGMLTTKKEEHIYQKHQKFRLQQWGMWHDRHKHSTHFYFCHFIQISMIEQCISVFRPIQLSSLSLYGIGYAISTTEININPFHIWKEWGSKKSTQMQNKVCRVAEKNNGIHNRQ